MTDIITSETPATYENETIRKHAEHLVRNEVVYCVSSLISSLAKATAEHDVDGLSLEDILSLCVQDDWETTAREYIDGLDLEDLQQIADYINVSYVETDTCETLERSIIAECEEDPDQWREVCDLNNLDPETVEAYEHWIVSSWLADKLAAYGEMVNVDILGLTVWGRRTTGQSISIDSVMLSIARDQLAR